MSKIFDSLLKSNATWAEKFDHHNQDFFKKSAVKHAPQALWIGCADSRVPESVVLNVKPGTVFTHRNIANQFRLKDDNVLAVLDYAIEHLNITHVMVVGHTGCDGVEAAYDIASSIEPEVTGDPLHRWLEELAKLIKKRRLHLKPKEEALPLIVKSNIQEQVIKLRQAPSVVKARNPIRVQGWLYNLKDGKLETLEDFKN